MQQTPLVLITFLLVVIIITILIGLISAFLLLYQKRQHAFLNKLEDIKTEYERELLTSQLELQEQTLQHYSQEIHDNIGQYISLSKLHLISIGHEASRDVNEKLANVVDLLTKTLQDLRDLSKSLGLANIRANGLSKAIEDQVEQLVKTKHYKVEYTVLGNYNYLEEQIEIILFRILQEAISNIIRHASANTINISLDCSVDGVTRMSIQDNGKGFETTHYLSNEKSFPPGGLRNMSVRAKVINAQFAITSEPGAGTSISISVPYNHKKDD